MHFARGIFSFLAFAALTLAVGPLLEPASAQYFGRNKVQYESFDWRVLETEHFDIYHYESAHEAAVQAGRMAERWYSRLSRVLDHEIDGRQPIVLYADHPAFEQTNAIFGQIGEATGGVTEPLKRRVVLPLGASLKESDHVLGHELVHAFQFDITGQGPNAVGPDVPVALRMPLWFIEGMAEYLSIGSGEAPETREWTSFTTQWMRGAMQAEALPSWSDLGKRRYFPYRYGHAFWAYVGGRFGDDAVGQLLKAAARTGNLGTAFSKVLGVTPDTLVADWHRSTREQQEPVLEVTQPADSVAEVVLSEGTSGTQQNLGPALSPDGELMVFASEKSMFSIDLFVADAETGEILRKLTDTARDPHFESLQWLGSTGAWSPDGERFALGAVVKGDPVISIYDPRKGEKVEEIEIEEVGEVFNPTWSPDGSRIAFSAQKNGYTDLWVLDVESGEVRQVTDDAYADLHPAWAPDGSGIAEVTDRFGADLEQLEFPDYGLAMVDPETGERTEIAAFEEANHLNPQWGPGGRDLFFLSDQNGVTNVYRLDRQEDRIYQITNVQTGVSGISPLSPALTVAGGTGAAAFTVHGKGSFVFDVYRMDDEEKLAGTPVQEAPDLAALNPAQLPPEERVMNQVDELVTDADLGLPDALTFRTRDYDPTLSLDFIGRPNLAVGTSEFGFFAGGGGSAFFSDMLGNQNLATLAQISSAGGEPLKSSAAFANYINQGDRWNWGFRGGQIPIIDRFCCFNRGTQPIEEGGEQEALAFSDLRFWQINRQVDALLQYPFHRSLRADFSVGFRNQDFAAEERLLFVNQFGQIAETRDREFTALDSLSSITSATASAALVYDNTVFGATAPMLGQRYRLEVTPQVGGIDQVTALADYRRYFMPTRPFTLAFRGMHIGRYGDDADDFRQSDFFLGSPGIVRGYDFGFGDLDQCSSTASGLFDCQDFDLLTGSRIAVFNAEARLPLLGGIGLIPAANVPPIDLFTFFDAGTAWNGDLTGEPTGPFESEQDPDVDAFDEVFKSAGVGSRVNVFGLAVFEISYARAFDRINDQGEEGEWVWQFNIVPGF